MPAVASVRLRYASQDYWFDPNGLEVKEGDHVVVETTKGKEIGLCTQDVKEVDADKITKPLKPILRIATEEDLERADELQKLNQDALALFHDLVEKNGLDMAPALVEFSFDKSHATFYFTSDERVDFRGLVRELASEFHTRVDMRQIGPRDEARMLGGLGHCGEELCCSRLGGEFQPVSIRMAKEQDLPLNPTKISGLCGRLMCCLRYEFEAYKDFKSRAPKKNGIIDTPDGIGKVIEFDTPRETVTLRMEDGSTLKLPVDLLDTGDKVAKEGERIRPCHISQVNFDKVMEELANDSNLAMMGEKLFSDDPDLADTTAEAGSIERVSRRHRSSDKSSRGSGDSGRKPRRRSSGNAPQPKARDERKARRSVSAADGTEVKRDGEKRDGEKRSGDRNSGNSNRSRNKRRSTNRQGNSSPGNDSKSQNSKPRPGQHSSTVSGKSSSNGKSGESGDGANKRRRRHRGGRGRSGSGAGKSSSGGSNSNGSGQGKSGDA